MWLRTSRIQHVVLQSRRASTFAPASNHDPALIRNIALVAHIDSGKTTLTESILHASSFLSVPGTVDSGSTTTDFLPAERERGITIQAASIPVKWKKWTFNLIDTPGHADFGMEVESASRVIDGAVVVIDSVEGVEAQTRGVWRQLDRYEVPSRIVFLNKLDRPGASFRSSFLSLLAHRLHPKPVVLSLPIASFEPNDYHRAEPGIEGLVDLVNWEVLRWKKGVVVRSPLPRTVEDFNATNTLVAAHPLRQEIIKAREALLETLCDESEELMTTFMSLSSSSPFLDLPTTDVMTCLRKLVLRQAVLPVLCGSAFKHVGTSMLLTFIGELLASPLDVQGESHSENGPQALAWKVGHDPKRGWMTFVRVYSGTLTRHASLNNPRQGQCERVTKLQLLYASQPKDVDQLGFGAVGVVLGLRHTRTGDTLISAQGTSKVLRDIKPPPAVISASVIPESHADLKPVQEALLALQRTDPSVRIETDTEGQLLVHGLGALHLEIVEGRLRDEYGVQCRFGRRRVGFREGYGGSPTTVKGTWLLTVDGRVSEVHVTFAVSALTDLDHGDDVWDGNLVLNKHGQAVPSPEALSTQAIPTPLHFISQGVKNALSTSLNSSLALTRVRIQVMSFELPSPSTALTTLIHASSQILRNHFREIGLGPILEPYVHVKVEVAEEIIGRVIKDLTEHAGEILDLGDVNSASLHGGLGTGDDVGPYPTGRLYVPANWLSPSSASSHTSKSVSTPKNRAVHALAPLGKMLDYLLRLRAMSGGRGEYDMSGAGFRVVSPARRDEILREIGKL